ncbi:Aldo/keto reductase [Sistotremastrum niveocremeum HHB9708]|uniref:Aldo/keto reductase n=1 Tax=Sistotremastrum niveocremeum HHB9708 TaxID=1314777 RepID=A0A164QY80_9AGAM|nr:Aldo/keto reductase [Sistotremastrum niveocremeum HHB9708]
MTFGKPGREGARVHDLKDVSAILDVFQKHGHNEVDTARGYTGGTSEEYLGELDGKSRGLIVSTKLYPGSFKHTDEGIREHLAKSLAALKTNQLDILYLHAPDRTTPWEVTFKVTNELYKEGKFVRVRLSRLCQWEVAEVVTLCRANGWVQPTVYQGIYNAIHRAVEPELFPCLRKFGISFYEYNPLGGGFFTGRYKGKDSEPEIGSRFDTSKGTNQSKNYRLRYWNDQYFKALDVISASAKEHNLTIAETALRWINHHSFLKREYGDAIIIGASRLTHIEENLLDFEKGPLPEPVLRAIDDAWDIVKGDVKKYWH